MLASVQREPATPAGRPRRWLIGRWPALLAVLIVATAVLAAGCAGGGTAGQTPSTQGTASRGPGSTQTTAVGSSSTTPSPTTQPPSTAPATTGATDGSPDSGDPYFPALGNGGYDVQDYDISLDIDPGSGRIAGTEVMTAVALQDLSAFYLDLQGLDVTVVHLDGQTASFRREGQELRVTCPAAVAKGARFTVATTYSGVPTPITAKLFSMGWQKTGDTIFTLDEPQGASSWFPVNDTPADKATYTFHLTVPAPYTAAANGVLVSDEPAETGRMFTWNMDKPMASYLAAVDVGKFSSETSTSAGGVAIRNYFATDLTSAAHAAFSRTGDVIDYFASLFGPYPFAVYGVVVPDSDSGAAMENQTLSLFGRDVVTKKMVNATSGAIFLSHELAHQWFGDSVTIEHWDDIWLSEGFATYASWLWLEHDQGRQALDDQVALSQDLLGKTLEAPPGRPGADHMFGVSVYRRGALTLHALRLTVGEGSFFRTLRAWADRYKYGNADTPEFIALAKEEAPQVPAAQLDDLFQAWLYADKMPALPAPAAPPAFGQ
jgi:aminopeptidase N